MHARSALVTAMLHHVVSAASRAQKIDRVCLLGPTRRSLSDELGLSGDLNLLTDPGTGLNPAVQSALHEATLHGVTRVIFIHADLPGVTPEELDLLADAPADTLAIAPDRHGTGTNALSLPLPAGQGFSFAFGPDSFALHSREAVRTGLKQETIRSTGLEQDIDEPADLPDAHGLLKNTHG